jgi:hypothetical protein
LISYRFEARPFVPSPFDLVVFWAALGVNLFVSVLMTLVNLEKRQMPVSLVLILLTLFQCGNIRLYVVSVGLTQKRADEAKKKANSYPRPDEGTDGDGAV